VVKTFEELVANPIVVLKRKIPGKGLSVEATLSLVGIGLALISMRKDKKKVGGVREYASRQYTRVKESSMTTKALIVGGLAVGIYLLFKYKPTVEQKKELAAAQSELDRLAKEEGIVPSLVDAQYASLVAVIFKAIDKCGTETDAIYRSFRSLNNEADVYRLIIEWGIAKYDGCFEGKLPFWTVHYTLSQALASDLWGHEVDIVNQILYDSGIKYRF